MAALLESVLGGVRKRSARLGAPNGRQHLLAFVLAILAGASGVAMLEEVPAAAQGGGTTIESAPLISGGQTVSGDTAIDSVISHGLPVGPCMQDEELWRLNLTAGDLALLQGRVEPPAADFAVAAMPPGVTDSELTESQLIAGEHAGDLERGVRVPVAQSGTWLIAVGPRTPCACGGAKNGPYQLTVTVEAGRASPPPRPREHRVHLPRASRLAYGNLAAHGITQAGRWSSGSWYCEYLGCTHAPYRLLTIWGEVPMFEAADALQIAHPSGPDRALVDRFAHASEHYWNPYLGGWAPYPEDRYRGAEAWFDDNGWLGLAFLNAYRATHERGYLGDAQRAFRFISSHGWDAAGGGGMWWNTRHPYHSGPALASDSLLGILLYERDREHWQLEDVKKYVDWANAWDRADPRALYLEKSEEPESILDYVQAPLIYAQYLLCKHGLGQTYCEQARKVADTMANNYVGYTYNYGPEYDAIFLQWMMAYGRATHDTYWLRLAELNAAAASRHAARRDGLWLSSWWGGPIADPETHPEMFRTMAATTSLFAWLAVYSR